jgi:hypothetical protein
VGACGRAIDLFPFTACLDLEQGDYAITNAETGWEHLRQAVEGLTDLITMLTGNVAEVLDMHCASRKKTKTRAV